MFAHSLPGCPSCDWEPLPSHASWVADGCEAEGLVGAAGFARAFGAGDWARVAGFWHDLGKYSPQFQAYLKKANANQKIDIHDEEATEKPGRVDHSTAGARHAFEQFKSYGLLLAYIIAGHHAGLPNYECEKGEQSSLIKRLTDLKPETREAIKVAKERAAESQLDLPCPVLPDFDFDMKDGQRQAFQLAFFVRMLFSCLVDADFLATERFMSCDRADQRPRSHPTMSDLRVSLETYLAELRASVAARKLADTMVNRWRLRVQSACLDAAQQRPGFFALTVPTGGGKTLSSLSFALHHAQAHNLRRVIVAIPFTSIIEQNASQYRKALGPYAEYVLEHHSSLDPGKETTRNRLAAENWDAPVVVTTNVQLFESLFASRTSRCRKLHRIANSVIVLDEAQALPPNLLKPTLWALQELVTNYGCSVVLCTATQPALEKPSDDPSKFDIGLDNVQQIIPLEQREQMFRDLKRVEVEQVGKLSDDALAEQLAEHEQVLCIVNTKPQAKAVFEKLTARLDEGATEDDDGPRQSRVETCLHLSANMCPAHRSRTLRLIHWRLRAGRPCRVISTQLVEAGVDVDFPVVYRALTGLDSIAQAAGRCNREGKLDTGRVVVFTPDEQECRTPGFVKPAINAAQQVMPDHVDLLLPEAQHAYFRMYFHDEKRRTEWDRPHGAGDGASGVLACFECDSSGIFRGQFKEAAQRYRLIDDNQLPIIVPYGQTGKQLIQQLEAMEFPPGRDFVRKLQRYTVQVRKRTADKMYNDRQLMPPDQTHNWLVLSNPANYDRRFGLDDGREGWDGGGLYVG